MNQLYSKLDSSVKLPSQIATDQCYKDTSNLKGKQKKHNATEEEIQIKEVRVIHCFIFKTVF